MPAEIIGSGPPTHDGDPTFLVRDQLTGTTAPASLEQLKPHPDLYAAAVSLSSGQAAGGEITRDAQGNRFNPDNPKPQNIRPALSLAEAINTPGRELAQYDSQGNTLAAGSGGQTAIGTNPDGSPMVAPAPAPATGASGGWEAPVTPPGPPAGPPGGPPPPEPAAPVGGGAPRGTARAAAPAGPDALDNANKEKMAGELAGEANERTVYDQEATARTAMMQTEAQRQTSFRLAAEDAFRQQQDAQKQALDAHNLDPNKFWQDKGALGGILFTISAAAQGAAGGWNGHPEAGTEYINNAIKQNLDIQQKRAEALDRNAEAKGNLVQHFRQAGLDDMSAFQAAMAAQKEMVATDLKRAAIKLNDKGFSPAALTMAGTLDAQSVKDHADLAKTRAETVLANTGAGKNVAETREINQKVGIAGQQTRADQYARALGAAGQPIPKALALLTSPELQKNITGDGQLLTGEASAGKVNEAKAGYGQHENSLNYAETIAKDPNSTPEQLDQAANSVKVSSKVFNDLKRGQEGDKDLLELNPGFKEFIGGNINWAEPGRRERFIQHLNQERQSAARRTSGSVQAYGAGPVKAPASTLLQPGVAQ